MQELFVDKGDITVLSSKYDSLPTTIKDVFSVFVNSLSDFKKNTESLFNLLRYQVDLKGIGKFSEQDISGAIAVASGEFSEEHIGVQLVNSVNLIKKQIDSIYSCQEFFIRYELERLGAVEQHAHSFLTIPRDQYFDLFLKIPKDKFANFESAYKKNFNKNVDVSSIQNLAKTDYVMAFKMFNDIFDKKNFIGDDKARFDKFFTLTKLVDPLLDEFLSSNPSIDVAEVFKKIFLSYINRGIYSMEMRFNFLDKFFEKKGLMFEQIKLMWSGYELAVLESGKPFELFFILGFRRATDKNIVPMSVIIDYFDYFKNDVAHLVIGMSGKVPVKVSDIIVGVDINCYELKDSPDRYGEFFVKIKEYNEIFKNSPLMVTFHIGENLLYTPETVIRWVHEIVVLHQEILGNQLRLGHVNVLGIVANKLIQRTYSEPVEERLKQIDYDIKYKKQLEKFGVNIDDAKLLSEKLELEKKNLKENILKSYSPSDKKQLQGRQLFVMNVLESAGVVIESCPTSNTTLNAAIDVYKNHPIKNFLKNPVRFSINTDDLTIFGSDLVSEYCNIAREQKLKYTQLLDIIKTSRESRFSKDRVF